MLNFQVILPPKGQLEKLVNYSLLSFATLGALGLVLDSFTLKLISLTSAFIAAVGICWNIALFIKYVNHSKSWPSTDALLHSAAYSPVRSGGPNSSWKYLLHVEYEYYIDKRSYKCKQYSLGGNQFSDKDKIESFIQEVKTDENFIIYYNPLLPSESVIKTGFQNDAWFIYCAFFLPFIPLSLAIDLVFFN